MSLADADKLSLSIKSANESSKSKQSQSSTTAIGQTTNYFHRMTSAFLNSFRASSQTDKNSGKYNMGVASPYLPKSSKAAEVGGAASASVVTFAAQPDADAVVDADRLERGEASHPFRSGEKGVSGMHSLGDEQGRSLQGEGGGGGLSSSNSAVNLWTSGNAYPSPSPSTRSLGPSHSRRNHGIVDETGSVTVLERGYDSDEEFFLRPEQRVRVDN